MRHPLEDENNEGFLQKMYWCNRVESGHFGDLITADPKILNEESESRKKSSTSVVVQDLATQWIQSYPCKTETSLRKTKELAKVLGAKQET